MEKWKKKIMKEAEIGEEELKALIEKKRNLPGISGIKMALTAVAQQLGIENKELMETLMDELILSDSLKKIGELKKGMRCASLVARVSRILPKRSGKRKEYQNIFLVDDTGQILCTFFGETISKLENSGLEIGDSFLIKCVNVRDFGGRISLTAIEETKIRKIEEREKLTKNLPELKRLLSVKKVLDISEDMELGETNTENLKGVLVWKGEIREFERDDGSIGKVMNFRIAGLESDESIRGVAWGKGTDLVQRKDLGDILQIRGGRIKVSDYQLDRGAEKREALEVHIGNLTSIERTGRRILKLDQAKPGIRGELFYVYALEPPEVREYEREGENREMLFLEIGDDTGVARLVVWNQESIKSLKGVQRQDQLKCFGNVKEGEFYDTEIHVSSTGEVKRDPPDFPEKLDWSKIQTQEVSKRSQPTEHIGLITDFSQLVWNTRCDIEGELEYKDIKGSRKGGEGTIIIGDGKNRLEGTIKEGGILEKMKKIPQDSRIRLENVVTPKKGGKYDLEHISIGKQAALTILEEEMKKVKRSPRSEKEEQSTITPLLLQEVQEEGLTEVLVTVNRVKEVKMKDYCSICGGTILSTQGETKICEKGHKTEARSFLSIILVIGDGEETGSAIIKGGRIQELGLTNKSKSEILSQRSTFIKEIENTLVGEDLHIQGEIRFEGGEIRMYVKDLKFVDPTQVTEKILDKISKIQKRD